MFLQRTHMQLCSSVACWTLTSFVGVGSAAPELPETYQPYRSESAKGTQSQTRGFPSPSDTADGGAAARTYEQHKGRSWQIGDCITASDSLPEVSPYDDDCINLDSQIKYGETHTRRSVDGRPCPVDRSRRCSLPPVSGLLALSQFMQRMLSTTQSLPAVQRHPAKRLVVHFIAAQTIQVKDRRSRAHQKSKKCGENWDSPCAMLGVVWSWE